MSETRGYNLRNPRVKEAANPEVARMEDEHNYTHPPPIEDEQQSEVGGGFSLPNVEDDKDRPNVSIPTTVEALSQSARPKARLNTTVTYSHDWTREHAGANTDIRFDAGDAVTSLALPNLMTTRPLLTRSTSSIQPDVSGDAPGSRHLMTDVTSRQTLVGTPLISSEPKLRIPTYDGKQDFESFWVQFKFISNQFHWDEEKTLMHLVSSLRDAALTYVSRLPIRSQCDQTEMVASLKRRFGDNVLPETHRASLENMKKDSRESLPEYATRVREIMSKAYPGLEGTELYTKLLIEHVVKGLPDASIVYDVLTKKPQTLETALDLIEWHECCKTMKKKSTNVRRLTDEREFEVRHVGNNESGNPVTEERLNLICADLKSELAEHFMRLRLWFPEGKLRDIYPWFPEVKLRDAIPWFLVEKLRDVILWFPEGKLRDVIPWFLVEKPRDVILWFLEGKLRDVIPWFLVEKLRDIILWFLVEKPRDIINSPVNVMPPMSSGIEHVIVLE